MSTRRTMCLIIFIVTSLNISQAQVTKVTNGNAGGTNRPNTYRGSDNACVLSAQEGFHDELKRHLSDGVSLVEMELKLLNHPSDALPNWSRGLYKPYLWVRSTGKTGESLLRLDEGYGFMSLFTLSMRVAKMTVDVTDTPTSCLKWQTPGEAVVLIRKAIMSGFALRDSDLKTTDLGENEDICNMHVVNDEGYARFQYQCCHGNEEGRVICREMVGAEWRKLLAGLLGVMKIMVFLFSPLLLPGWIYRNKYRAMEYIHHVPNDPLTLKVVVTHDPSLYGEENQEKVVRLSELQHMEYFKTMVASSRWQQERIYELTMEDCRLSVCSRRLLEEGRVPVTLSSSLYNAWVRCRIGREAPLHMCCSSSVLGRCSNHHEANGQHTFLSWKECLKIMARCCLLLTMFIPCLFRLVIYFKFQMDIVNERSRAAKINGLRLDLISNLTSTFHIHGLFIFTLVFVLLQLTIYGLLTPGFKVKVTKVILHCLSDMRDRSRLPVVCWLASLLTRPLAYCGILGCLFYPFYVIVVVVIAIPIVAFYTIPSINLTIRLLIHFFLIITPRPIQKLLKKVSRRLNFLQRQIKLHEVTLNETFETKHCFRFRDVILQAGVITIGLVSFWSITLVVMETISFLFEMSVYTFLGVLVNSTVTFHIFSLLLLIFIYGHYTISRVVNIYLRYFKCIHSVLTAMTQGKMDALAKQDDSGHRNTAFRADSYTHRSILRRTQPSRPVLVVKNQMPSWVMSSVLVFIDHSDRKYTAEKFFRIAQDLTCSGCPGHVYRNAMKAAWDFTKILFFLLALFLSVMTYGDAFNMSSTNQMLATFAVGLVPFFYKKFWTSGEGASINTSSFRFQSDLHRVINDYQQRWPVFDIIPDTVREMGVATNTTTTNTIPTTKTTYSSQDGENNKDVNPSLSIEEMDELNQDGDYCCNDDNIASVGIMMAADTASDDGDSRDASNSLQGRQGHRLPLVTSSSSTLSDDKVKVDIIVDLSTSNTRSTSFLRKRRGFEMGSLSMLDFNRKSKSQTTHEAKTHTEHV